MPVYRLRRVRLRSEPRRFRRRTTRRDILLAVNGEASPARGNPARYRAGFRTFSPEVGGTGFVPRSGASCGAVTGAPTRERVIDARFLGASLSQAVMPHGTVGSVTLPRPVGRVPVLTNDANPAVGCRTDPWEPTPGNTRDASFSASRTPAQVPRADATLANVYETACTKHLGFGEQSSAVAQHRVGFTPAVNGGILSLIKDSGGSLENDGDYSIDLLRQGGSDQGPDSHDSTNELKVHVVPAYDSVHQPSEPYATKTYDALDIFADEFNVDVTHEIHIGYWTAASTGKDTYDIIDTLEYQDPFLNYDWEVVTGWVDEMNNNGVANRDGYYSVNACITNNGVDWDHERIVQHEISHNFDAPDRGTLGYEHEKCIMNYEYAYRGIDYWCSEDNYIVDVNINHED